MAPVVTVAFVQHFYRQRECHLPQIIDALLDPEGGAIMLDECGVGLGLARNHDERRAQRIEGLRKAGYL